MNTANFLSVPASLFPEQEIVVFEGKRLTYGELAARVRRLAGALARLGVGRGGRVAVLQTNSHRYIEAYYATATLGAVFVPLNYRAKLAELEYMIAEAKVSVLLVGGRYRPLVEQLRPRIPTVENLVSLEGPAPGMHDYESLLEAATPVHENGAAEVEENETTILMYTSGTTALPKGVLLTHGDFTAYVTGNVELADGSPRGTALLCVPLYHIAGATNMMTTLWTGRRVALLRQFDAAQWLATVKRERVTHTFVVPTMLKQILDHPDFAASDLGSLETLAYGGAPMPFPVIRRAIEAFPASVGFVNAFGQTETTSTLTVLGPEDHRLEGSPAEVEKKLRRLTSIGRPLPDVELQVMDDDGQPVPRGSVGEIAVRTPRVMRGYATLEAGVPEVGGEGWFRTRDLGWMDEDGYVYVVGRRDDIIIRGGENIAPAEVEAVLQSHPAVEEAAVIGVPDVEWGQKVAAVVALRSGARAAAEELAGFCRARLATFKRPEVIHFVDALPRNPMGKVLRKELRELLATSA